MLIKSCVSCKFHKVKQAEDGEMSYCRRENCYSRYAKCVAGKALARYLAEESSQVQRRFSALRHAYPSE
jgi:hypothetical protein